MSVDGKEREQTNLNSIKYIFVAALGVKMGRIPKLVKERALREFREQQMKKKSGSIEGHGRESTCSSLSDRSVENYDPNPMETGLFVSIFLSRKKKNLKNFFFWSNISFPLFLLK